MDESGTEGVSDGRIFGERERGSEYVSANYTKCKFCIIEGSEMRGKRHIAQNACISPLWRVKASRQVYYNFYVYVSHAPFCEPTDVSDGAIVSPDTFAADSRGRLSLQVCGSHFVGRIAGFIFQVALRVSVWFAFCDRIYGLPSGL